MDWLWQPLAWIGLNLVLTVGAWNLAWRLRPRDAHVPGGRAAAFAGAMAPNGYGRRAVLAGLPLTALWLRVVSPDAMGLVPPRSVLAILVTGTLAVGLAVFGDMVRGRLVTARQRQGRPRATDPQALGQLALGALCVELHWAFFRAAWLAIPGVSISSAVLFSLILAGLELLLDPWRRAALVQPEGIADFAADVGQVALSGVTFLLTGSSVLAFTWHIAVRWLLGRPAADRSEPVTGVTPSSADSGAR